MSDSRLTNPIMTAVEEMPVNREGEAGGESESFPDVILCFTPSPPRPSPFFERELRDEIPRAGRVKLNVSDARARDEHVRGIPQINLRQLARHYLLNLRV